MALLLSATEEEIRVAANLLAAGKLVAFPTETVYGLGADATNTDAVRLIYQAKGRPANNPLIVHVPDAAAARRWCGEWPPMAETLASAFWPGPLTVVVPASPAISSLVLAGGNTVGLRAPDHPVAQALLRAVGRPLAAPSANSSGSLSPVEAQHVFDSLGDAPELAAVLDGGRCGVGIESTVVDCTGDIPQILRLGRIAQSDLEIALNCHVKLRGADSSTPLRSPGQMDRHYAPRLRLRLLHRQELHSAPEDIARVFLGGYGDDLRYCRSLDRFLPVDPAGYARQLYASLWSLQESQAREIWVERPPDLPEWAAVLDRLQRASVTE